MLYLHVVGDANVEKIDSPVKNLSEDHVKRSVAAAIDWLMSKPTWTDTHGVNSSRLFLCLFPMREDAYESIADHSESEERKRNSKSVNVHTRLYGCKKSIIPAHKSWRKRIVL